MPGLADPGPARAVLARENWSLTDARMLNPLRRLVRAMRARKQHLLHPFRRRALVARLGGMESVERILVLCLGNICRSPYGEARLVASLNSGPPLEIRSAGLMGPGRAPPEYAQSVAHRRGLDLTDHRSQLVTQELLAWADLTVVMSPHQARALRRRFKVDPARIALLGDLDPETPDRREIPDPLNRSVDFFEATYQRMDRCLAQLLRVIR